MSGGWLGALIFRGFGGAGAREWRICGGFGGGAVVDAGVASGGVTGRVLAFLGRGGGRGRVDIAGFCWGWLGRNAYFMGVRGWWEWGKADFEGVAGAWLAGGRRGE